MHCRRAAVSVPDSLPTAPGCSAQPVKGIPAIRAPEIRLSATGIESTLASSPGVLTVVPWNWKCAPILKSW